MNLGVRGHDSAHNSIHSGESENKREFIWLGEGYLQKTYSQVRNKTRVPAIVASMLYQRFLTA